MQKIGYIHENPVAAGLVRCAADYRLSSAIDYQTGSCCGLLEVDLLLSNLKDQRRCSWAEAQERKTAYLIKKRLGTAGLLPRLLIILWIMAVILHLFQIILETKHRAYGQDLRINQSF